MDITDLNKIKNAHSFTDIHRGTSVLLTVYQIDFFFFLFFHPNANDIMDTIAVTNIAEPHAPALLRGMQRGDQRFEVLRFAFSTPYPHI